jgi:hypothetical protein
VKVSSADFDITDQLLTRYSAFSDTGEKREYNGTEHQLLIDFEKAYDSVSREVLYNILIEFGIPTELDKR